MKTLIQIITLLISTTLFAFPTKPDSKITYPHFCTTKSKRFDGLRYSEKIPHCKRYVSTKTRKKVYASYGIAWSDRGQYTIDHLISLAFGGSNNIVNLWPQHKSISSAVFEGRVYRMVKKGLITNNEALNKVLEFKYGKK